MFFNFGFLKKEESVKESEELPELSEEEFKAVISDIKAEATSETCKGSLASEIDYALTNKDCPGGIWISMILGKPVKFCAKCHRVIGYKVKGKPPP